MLRKIFMIALIVSTVPVSASAAIVCSGSLTVVSEKVEGGFRRIPFEKRIPEEIKTTLAEFMGIELTIYNYTYFPKPSFRITVSQQPGNLMSFIDLDGSSPAIHISDFSHSYAGDSPYKYELDCARLP